MHRTLQPATARADEENAAALAGAAVASLFRSVRTYPQVAEPLQLRVVTSCPRAPLGS